MKVKLKSIIFFAVVQPEEWTAVQSNRSNQGLGSVRRNNEIFDTSSNPPTDRH